MTSPALFDLWSDAFATVAGPDAGPWHDRRAAALEAFGSLGWPGRKHEEYRYLSFRRIAGTAWQPAPAPTVDDAVRAAVDAVAFDEEGARVVLVDGHLVPELSTVADDVTVLPLADAIAVHGDRMAALVAAELDTPVDGLVALQQAFATRGVVVHVGRDVEVRGAVHLVHVTSSANGAAHFVTPQHFVLADRFARVHVVESWTSVEGTDAERLVMPSVFVDVADGASVDHVKVQLDAESADHVGRGWVRVGRDARYHHFIFGLGGRLYRDTHTIRATAPGSETLLSALWAPRPGQSIDLHTAIDHLVPDCTSDQLYKCVLGERGHGVFNGKVFVRQDAQRTAAEQLNKNLLLHPTARVDTKPQLEIFADDVTCAHGATIGRLDSDELFYLHARGIDEPVARQMLVEGFAEDVLDRLDLPGLYAALRSLVLDAVATTASGSDDPGVA